MQEIRYLALPDQLQLGGEDLVVGGMDQRVETRAGHVAKQRQVADVVAVLFAHGLSCRIGLNRG